MLDISYYIPHMNTLNSIMLHANEQWRGNRPHVTKAHRRFPVYFAPSGSNVGFGPCHHDHQD